MNYSYVECYVVAGKKVFTSGSKATRLVAVEKRPDDREVRETLCRLTA